MIQQNFIDFEWFWHRTSDFWGLGIGSHWWCWMWACQARSGTPRGSALTLNPTGQTIRKIQLKLKLSNFDSTNVIVERVQCFISLRSVLWIVRFHYIQSLSGLVLNYLPERMTCRWPEVSSNWHWCRMVSLSPLEQIEILVFNANLCWPWMRHLSKALVYPSPYIRTGLQRLMNIDEL